PVGRQKVFSMRLPITARFFIIKRGHLLHVISAPEGRVHRPAVGKQKHVRHSDLFSKPIEQKSQVGVAIEYDLRAESSNLTSYRRKRTPLLNHVCVAPGKPAKTPCP